MACITIVREIKNIHPADIALIKLGSFFKVFGKDACIISKIFKYKIIQGETLTCGFPIKSINKIKAGLENKKINYMIINSKDNYNVIEKEDFKNLNKYDSEYQKSKMYINNQIRIDKIYEYLNKNINDKEIKCKLTKIEEILNERR